MRTLSLVLLALWLVLGGCAKRDPWEEIQGLKSVWVSRAGTYGGRPIAIRINRGLDPAIGKLKYQVAVTLPLIEPQESGLPGFAESETLKVIGAMLEKMVREQDLGVGALEIRCDKTCDFIFFTNDSKRMTNAFAQLPPAIKGHSRTVRSTPDPDWTTYRWFSEWNW